MSELLVEGLRKTGILEENIPALAEKMNKYISEIILYNSAYNLTNTSDYDELVIRHILDSLSAFEPLKKLIVQHTCGICSGGMEGTGECKSGNYVIGDIGSGGGFPGIPLAAAMPHIRFKLVERMEKRCSFLENCVAVLGLKNVEVVNLEAERVAAEAFDLVTFRAFRPLDKKITKNLLRIKKSDGCIAAYKAKLENIKEEMEGIKDLVPEYKIIKLEVPGLEDSERNLVVI